jgi:hypothetical protein
MTEIKKTHVVAHVLAGLVTFALIGSAAFKFSGAQAIVENFEKLHLTPFRIPIALGTLLLTGYLGGAVVAHLTSNDAVGAAPALILGVLAWGANYLRNRQMFESITRA